MNRAEEDYVKMIYLQTVEKDLALVKLQELSEEIGVTIQTTNEMIKRLEKNGLVKYIPYKGVKLTKQGENEAIRMIRSHRVLEVFLTETLKFNWGEVHEDAELLEHSASERVINALYNFLGKPESDPHGNPIPKSDVETLPVTQLSIHDLVVGDKFVIERVSENKSLLSYLDKQGIKLKDEFTLKAKDVELGVFEIEGKNTYTINSNIAKLIYVKLN